MKLIIIESTQVNYHDDKGGVHVDSSEFVDIDKDQAKKLTEANRALYVNKADDPFKDGRFTASQELLDAAKKLSKAKTRAKAVDPQPGIGDPGVPGTEEQLA